eukprot:m.72990 g.72990  ORF g.72990 m.72990 type:complete len:1501 (-) comp13012_c0_seq2:31-4533(-)
MEGDRPPARLSMVSKHSSGSLIELPPRNSLSDQPPPASRVLNHGTTVQGKILPSPQSVMCSLFFKTPQEVWVLDTSAARLWTGWPLVPDDSLKRLAPLSTKTALHAHFAGVRPECIVLNEQKCVLVWARGHPTVCLFDVSLQLLSTSTISPPQVLTFNPSTNEVLACDQSGKILAYIADNTRGLHLRNTLSPVLPESEHSPSYIHALTMDDNETHHQRLFAACGRVVSVCEMSGKHISLISPAHNAHITSILYLSHAETLLTGSEDGAIKVWDALLQLVHVFVAHTGAVTTLIPYPLQPHMFLSASLDTTVRVWSTQTLDEALVIHVNAPVLNVSFLPAPHTALLAVIAEESITLWQLSHLYRPFAVLNNATTSMTRVEHARGPARLIAHGPDHISLLCPANGAVMTTCDRQRIEVVCVLPLPTLARVAVVTPTSVMLFDCGSNPSVLIESIPFDITFGPDATTAAAPLTLTTSSLTNTNNSNSTKTSTHKSTSGPASTSAAYPPGTVLTLVAVGTKQGRLGLLDASSGQWMWTSNSVHTAPVAHVVSTRELLVTLGHDRMLVTWKPHCTPRLHVTQLHLYYLTGAPLHVAALGLFLCVSFSIEDVETIRDRRRDIDGWPIEVCSITSRETYTHHPLCDHRREVTAIAACPALDRFASASLDPSIKIWNLDSDLLLTVTLDQPITSLCFATARCDIVLAMRDQLYILDADLLFEDHPNERDIVEVPLPGPACASPTHVQLSASALEIELAARRAKTRQERLVRQESFARQQRDRDHDRAQLALRDDLLAGMEKARMSTRTESPPPLAKIPKAAARAFMRAQNPRHESILAIRQQYRNAVSSSPPPQPDPTTARLRAMPLESGYQRRAIVRTVRLRHAPLVAPDAYLPNSVVLDMFGDPPPLSDRPTRWQPKALRPDQLTSLSERPSEMDDEIEEDEGESALMTLALQASDDEEEEIEEEEEEQPPTPPPPPRTAPKSNGFKPLEPREPPPPSTHRDSRSPTPPPPTPPAPPTPIRQRTPTPPTPEKPPSPPPLPRAISQFRGQGWFSHYFPQARPSTFDFLRRPPVNNTVQQVGLDSFVSYISGPLANENRGVGLLQVASIEHSAEILQAIRVLAADPNFTFADEVVRNVLRKLAAEDWSPAVPAEQALIVSALEALIACAATNPIVIVEVLAWASLPRGPVSLSAQGILNALGLKDKKNVFEEHLESLRANEQSLAALRRRWQDFFDSWTVKCTHHMVTQSVFSSIPERPASGGPGGSSAGGSSHRRMLGSAASFLSSAVSEARRASSFDSAAVAMPTPIDVLNYWITVEDERLRLHQTRPKRSARAVPAEPGQPAVRPDARPSTTLGRIGYSRASVRGRGDGLRDAVLPPLVGRHRAAYELPPRYVSLEDSLSSLSLSSSAPGRISPHPTASGWAGAGTSTHTPPHAHASSTTFSATSHVVAPIPVMFAASGPGASSAGPVGLSLAPSVGGVSEDGFHQAGLRAHNRLFVLAQSWARD